MTLPPPAPMAKGTLSRQLVVRTTALVAIATITLSFFTSVAGYQILVGELDGRLVTAAARRPGPTPGPGMNDPEGSGLLRIDLRADCLDETAADGWTDCVSYAQWPVALPSEQDLLRSATQLVAQLPLTSPSAKIVLIEDVGRYRLLVRQRGDYLTVVGLPWSEVITPLTRQLLVAGILTLGAIALAGFGARQVVEKSLRPLRRLASTASQVATLPLASGEGNLPVRVPQQDLDPRSEVGQVGVAFNQMLDHVEGALEARHRSETKVRQFVADASHELRNPLAAIRGYAELTRREQAELPSNTAHALTRIESESDRMSALVEDLLLLARLDSQPTLALQPTDVTQIVLNAVDDARVAGAGHRWELDLPDESLLAQADPHRLHQVVANLLANARVHTPPGTIVVTSLRREPSQVVIRVSDNGPGVPPEIHDTVFERFTRAEVSRVRHAGGSSTGLGLAIVAAVVAAHGGTVALESTPGSTTFVIRLPAA